MHVISVALLSVRIRQELTIVDFVCGRVFRLLRIRHFLRLLIGGHDLVLGFLGLLGRRRLAGCRRIGGIIGRILGIGRIGIAGRIGIGRIRGIRIRLIFLAERHFVKIYFRPWSF